SGHGRTSAIFIARPCPSSSALSRPSSRRFFFTSLVAALSSFVVADLGIDYTKLGLLIGVYFLPGIAIAYPGGLLGQYFGDKRIALSGMALMVAGGLLTAFCNNYAGLFVGRLTSGTGAVLLNVLLTKMTTDWFANREIGTALGLSLQLADRYR